MISIGKRGAGIAVLVLLSLPVANAQTIRFFSDLDRVVRDLDLIESPGLFRSAFGEDAVAAVVEGKGTRLEALPAETLVGFNSDFPFGYNDGALWQGKGLSGLVRAGAEYSWSWGNLRIQPEWWFAKNETYPLAATAPGAIVFEDYGGSLDRLQAYGTGFYTSFNYGQSDLRLRYSGFTLVFGTKNHKFGPAETQNLLLSDNASGFPMLDVGTDGPYRTAFGAFDARFFWGQTRTSRFWNIDGSVDYRFLAGGLVSYSAPFLPGMSFGLQRVFHSPWATINAWKFFEFFIDTVWKVDRGLYSGGPGQEDDVDQILSFTWEWRIPETGSRAYVEWGRNDHASNLQDFLMQPDHSYGYVLGLQQKIEIGTASTMLLTFEMADVGNTIGTNLRPTAPWYRHGLITGGYTNDGQGLGAYMGPGSNSQELNLYYRSGFYFVGVGIQRWLFDADYYYSQNPGASDSVSYMHYNLLVSESLRSGVRLGAYEIGASVSYTNNNDRDFIIGNNVGNWHAELSFKATLQ